MQSLLTEFLTSFLFVYIMVFVRFGTAIMIMPGFGDTFVSPQVRLYFVLALSLVVAPALTTSIPTPPSSAVALVGMVSIEAIIGFFIGTIARIMMSVLSVAGMMISMQSGLASAQVFNPTMSGQGSIIGAYLSVVGVVLIFVTDLHHLLILSVFHSYDVFPFATLGDVGDISQTITRLVAESFNIGIQFAVPFIIVSLMIYLALGVMARLMPQMQIFFIALPIQIIVSLMLLAIVVGSGLYYWLGHFESALIGILGGRG